MKKLLFSILAICIILGIFFFSPVQAKEQGNSLLNLEEENYQTVLNEIATKVVTNLPDDIHMRLLAIAPIQGDDGALVDVLTAKVKSETRYHLIERKDLNKILEEQGFQISPLADPRKPIEPGKIKGVEGLLQGQIVQKQCSFIFCKLEVFIKLNKVEGGDIVFAENFSEQFISPVAIYGLAGIAVLIFLIFYANHMKGKKGEEAVKVTSQDAAVQQDLQNELKKAKDNLNRIHDDLVAKDQMKLSSVIREVREDINTLLFKIEQGPGLHASVADKTMKKNLKSHSKSMDGLIKNVLAETEKLLKAAGSENEKGIQSTINALKTEIKNASNRFHERTAGRA